VWLSTLARVKRRERRRLALVACVLALGGAVVVAHSTLADNHMGAMMMVVCLAVAETAAVGITAAATSSKRPTVRLLVGGLVPTAPLLVAAPTPRARDGPSLLQVFRL
jgi:hypothetical protein